MKTNSKTSLFLMELIIVILFFSIASVVCVQLFVNAYNTNTVTKESSQATLIIQNLAEGYLGTDGDIESMVPLYDSAVYENGSLVLFYDNEWNTLSDSASASYTARISSSGSAGSGETAGGIMKTAVIEVSRTDGTGISSQDICHYVQFRQGDR